VKAILKKYKDDKNKNQMLLVDFGKALSKKGWHCNLVEGGYISPDFSAIFIFSRSPYNGQLLQYTANKEDEFKSCVNGFINSGEFVKI